MLEILPSDCCKGSPSHLSAGPSCVQGNQGQADPSDVHQAKLSVSWSPAVAKFLVRSWGERRLLGQALRRIRARA